MLIPLILSLSPRLLSWATTQYASSPSCATRFGYESYQGSLRGARGTLWSKAGNALDQASLLIALLRASGFPARYVQGTLTDTQAQELILSMFPPVLRVGGCPPADAQRADPANDPQLLAETRAHYWVEFDAGSGFQAADPTFKTAQVGQVFTATQGEFAEVPDTLRHKVTVRLKAEKSTAFLFGSGPQVTTVLNETFNTVELVGKPLSIGHFVNSSSAGGLVGGSVTHTYSPYILIGQGDGDIADDPIIRGTDYQEFFSSIFALANQVLTGVFLEMDVRSPDGKVETFERALVDRVGFAVRQNGGTVNLASVASGQPALSEFDLVTINALPGLQSLEAIAQQKNRLEPLHNALTALQPQIDVLPPQGPLTAEQQALVAQATDLARQVAMVSAETVVLSFAGASDIAMKQLEQGYQTKGYYVSPRLILSLTKVQDNTLSVRLDLRKTDLRAVPAPVQVGGLGFFFEMARGMLDTALEGELLASLTGRPVDTALAILDRLPQDATLTLIDPDTLAMLDTLDISAEAKARVSRAVHANRLVLVPDRMAAVQGHVATGWIEIVRHTGHTVGVTEDGGHQALIDYALLSNNPFVRGSAPVVGLLAGFSNGIFNFLGNFLDALNDGRAFVDAVKNGKAKVKTEIEAYAGKLLKKILPNPLTRVISSALDTVGLTKTGKKVAECFIKTAQKGESLLDFTKTAQELSKCFLDAGIKVVAGEVATLINLGVLGGLLTAFAWIDRNLPVDPPVFPFLSSDLTPGPAPIAPNTQPGIIAQIMLDGFFTVLVGEAEQSSVYKVQIQNLGPTADTFALTFPTVPMGFTLQSSVPTITIPPGATAEVGLCLQPTNDQLSPPTTAVPFSVVATSTTNPAITATASTQFITPDVHEVTLRTDPAVLSPSPGSTVAATLTLTAVGNVPEMVALRAEVPSGVSLSGLPGTVSLTAGETQSVPLSLTVAPGAALNQTLNVVITADLCNGVPPASCAAP